MRWHTLATLKKQGKKFFGIVITIIGMGGGGSWPIDFLKNFFFVVLVMTQPDKEEGGLKLLLLPFLCIVKSL